MSEQRSLQEWVHWFDEGEGARRVRFAAVALGALLLSCFVSYKQFRGPLTEATFAQAVVARQLASGEGFTTPVNYPQSFAWVEKMQAGRRFVNVTKPLPELHQPPLYSAVLGLALTVAPVRGARADCVLLAVNVALLWCAAAQTFFLARRLFDVRAGVVASCALLLSSPVWAAAMAVNGATLAMVLWLAVFQLTSRAYTHFEREDSKAPWLVAHRMRIGISLAGGVVAGLLFLCDYAAILILSVAIPVICFRAPSWRRVSSLVLLAAGFAAVTAPWLARNTLLTGNPLAFASQGIALKAGDPTAEPAARRATFSADAPKPDINKLGNKVLTAVRRGVGERAWAGGGIFLTAFFVAGFAYRFRDPSVNRLRWTVTGVIVVYVLSQAVFDPGEGERDAWLCLAPVIMIFGAGFFLVLIESNETLAPRAGLAAVVLLAAQALPLARDLAAPRSAHSYNYPPYLPALFEGIGQKLSEGRATPLAWMADVPAGAAWYSGRRVWMQPATMDGFTYVAHWQQVRALVLTPETLAKPYFGELTAPRAGTAAGTAGAVAATAGAAAGASGWAAVYRGLAAGRMPPGFPLGVPIRITPDFYVLVDPGTPVANP
jgi:hypothetical protein